jgi:hypothetical protein
MKNKDFLDKKEKAAAANKGPRQSDRRDNRPDRAHKPEARDSAPGTPAPNKAAAATPEAKPAETKDVKKD